MKIAEIYESIQGEGRLTGTRSVFVRVSGCNLRCTYCDTPYTSWDPEGDDLSIDEILQQVLVFSTGHVVVTGGEPMLFAELVPLCQRLKSFQKHITIETAGTLFLPLPCDLMSISPKLSNSTPAKAEHANWHVRHNQTRHQPTVIRQLMADFDYQLKFVIADREDCDEVRDYLNQFPDIPSNRVMMMPEGVDETRLQKIENWLQPYCDEHGFVFCPRKHIEWYGANRGT